MARVYHRSFDWDEARRLREADPKLWTYKRLAEHFGVSESGIQVAVRPELRERVYASAAAWQRQGTCPDCGARTSRVGGVGSLRCIPCSAAARVTTVREAELRCSSCGEWKPDEDFPRSKYHACRRHRRRTCTSCGTAARQAYRKRTSIPCTRCGKPRLAPNESVAGWRKRAGHRFTGLCLPCYQATRKAA
jgi:hypothetical protein